jgi:hypothetical protein
MKIIYLLTMLLLFVMPSLYAQYTNVQISNTGSPEETSIMINPRNLNELVAGSNLNFYYRSTNGGMNWTRNTLVSSQYGVWGDPCLIIDTAGHYYYFHLSNPPSGGTWIDRIVCQKSTNGGVNWSNPGTFMGMFSPKAQDKEWAVVDPRNNHIYVTWTQFDEYGSSSPLDSSIIFFSRSTDAGATWSPALRINKKAGDCIDEDNTTEGAVPAVGPNGELYVCWSYAGNLYFDKSTDGGNTWLAEDMLITSQPGGWDYAIPGLQRCNGLPITVCDLSSGPNRGTIYVNWTDQRNGSTDTDVFLIKSTNGGNTWSSVKRVNNDPAGRQQFFTWMEVDKVTGYLYFVFHDRRNYTDTRTDVYLARSTDGGETFQNYKVSSTPFTPSASVFFGDYNGITVHNNVVRPIWTRLEGTTLSIWTAIVDFTTGIASETGNIPASYSLSQNYPNPFNPETKIKYEVPSHKGALTPIRLSVYDAAGREVAVLVDGLAHPGSYEVTWSGAGYTSGVYFYRLITDNFTDTKKMVLIR